MELSKTSQPRYSWPEDGPGRSDSSSLVKASSCDLPDRNAQGDGLHNQDLVSSRMDSFFREEIRAALNQAQAEITSEETELCGLNYSPTVADRECSEEEFRSMNLFLKSFDLNDTEENPKNCDEIVVNAIKVGMFLETKRKESLIFDKPASGRSTDDGDATGSGRNERVPNADVQQHMPFKGDTTLLHCRSNVSDKETLDKTAKPLCMTTCAKCSHEEIECQNNSATLAYDAHISSNDLSNCEPENDNDEHAIVTKLTYPLHEERVSNELIEHQKMMHSEVSQRENYNMPPVGQSQGNGKSNTCLKKESHSAVTTHSSSAVTYRVELQGNHFNRKMVGRMIVAEDGVANLTCSEPDFDEVIILASNDVMGDTEYNEGMSTRGSPPYQFRSNLIGKVFTLKVVSLDSDNDIIADPEFKNMADVAEIENVINGIKRSASDLGNAVLFSPDCSLCLVKLTSAKHAKIHYSGKAHQRRTLLSSFGKSFGCDACNVTYTSPKHAEEHVIGRKHRSKVASLMEPAVTRVPVEDSKNIESIDEPLVCRVCSIKTNSRQSLIDHFNGTKHLKKLETLKEAHGEYNSRQDILDGGIISNANRMTGKTILPLRSTLDLSTNTNGPRTKPLHGDGAVDRSTVTNKQACHAKQSTHTPMSLPFQGLKSKFNLSNLKMVRTVGTQFTDSYRDMPVPCQEKLACGKKESDSCRGNMYCADSPYCSCDPASEGVGASDWRQQTGYKPTGWRKFKNRP